MAEAAARGLAAEPFRLHISSEVLDDLGQSPVTSRSHFPALDASDALAGAGIPDGSSALFAAVRDFAGPAAQPDDMTAIVIKAEDV